ncbi:hypothetical protein SUGI_0650200 [Cryptomeria japonica]|uniref:fasciclin-like arabinogalactan protein 16 n=1 Tax=Cryptomeria japonica TaxID=3369 RepID=UPI002414CEA2|nr:fasciclin-like arabinogalactan protein 16 [Cryptomeria japonica]GLJ32306.1 hypothetical protein SUGI_0650200 [Cryptomeria japonica]
MAAAIHCLLLSLVVVISGLKCSQADDLNSALNSSSVLEGLLESPYTDFVELIEKASLLQKLEQLVSRRNVTILAPPNSCFEGPAQASFRRFLLEPGNIMLLQRLLLFHVLPRRLTAATWPLSMANFKTLSSDFLQLWTLGNSLKVGLITVTAPDAIVRFDGVVHGVDGFLLPKIVQQAFAQWKKKRLYKESYSFAKAPGSIDRRRMSALGSAPLIPKAAPLAVAAAAPSPSYSSSSGSAENYIINGLLGSLFEYKDYSEMADLLVNMTSLASELARLVKEGYRLTILAPCNEAFAELTEEQLKAPEQTLLYHILAEYQTETSFYHSARRFGQIYYETLRVPMKLSARESDGVVEFGEGKNKARLYDNDIYADGFISVQGIDKLLVPRPGNNRE